MKSRTKSDQTLATFTTKLKHFQKPLMLENPVTQLQIARKNKDKAHNRETDTVLINRIRDLISDRPVTVTEISTFIVQ